ncbi:hypothetical protein L596_011362 [Steinernema carpocapsae]|uniref:Uncharacterized protein n=1 Tax=Steinernema carpocapsae TaxID=34508 RepID=A0A4U5NUL0_STECR|nr:hypothetical protein L596_011362 [Steinernema carpocapsae]
MLGRWRRKKKIRLCVISEETESDERMILGLDAKGEIWDMGQLEIGPDPAKLFCGSTFLRFHQMSSHRRTQRGTFGSKSLKSKTCMILMQSSVQVFLFGYEKPEVGELELVSLDGQTPPTAKDDMNLPPNFTAACIYRQLAAAFYDRRSI